MCKLCDMYNFGGIGWDFDKWGSSIYLCGRLTDSKFGEYTSFKFCPECGKKLTEDNFRMR